jgi:hypothetical protein
MNRERNKKLLTGTGFRVLTRPDGGVVTQRTANPLPRAETRDSSRPSRSVLRIVCQGADVPSANAQGIETRSAIDAQRRGPKGESPVAAGHAPTPHSHSGHLIAGTVG